MNKKQFISQLIKDISKFSLNDTGEEIIKKVKKAIMLVAGLGKRLRPLTNDIPKCLIRVNETSPLINALNSFAQYGINEVVLVTGYFSDVVKNEIGEKYRGMAIKYVINDKYDQTNNIYSLWMAKSHMDEDIIIMEGDIMIREDTLNILFEAEGDNLIVVSEYAEWMEGLAVGISNGMVDQMILTKDQDNSFNENNFVKTVNIYRLSKELLSDYLIPNMSEFVTNGFTDEFYEIIIKKAIEEENVPFFPVFIDSSSWIEIDTATDLNNARIFQF